MKSKRKSYYNEKWYSFSKSIKKRDNNKCVKCGRSKPEIVLQVHHTTYKPGAEPWEYSPSECITLCKGCHARNHKLIEPSSGWSLIEVNDLNGLNGICERSGCGAEMRYEHVIYHPKWGYKSVGSTCVEFLTEEDQTHSKFTLKILKQINEFVSNSIWQTDKTNNGIEFIWSKFSHHKIRIYGSDGSCAFQLIMKIKGEKWYDYKDTVRLKNASIKKAKELSFINLKALITDDENEKKNLRKIYRLTRNHKYI